MLRNVVVVLVITLVIFEIGGGAVIGAQIAQHGTGSGAVRGNVGQGPCSSLQIGGSNNQSTVNCGPPAPQLREKTLGLARDISEYLSRQRKTRSAPSWEEFVGLFGDRTVSVSDELASAGLSDFRLQQTKKGNVGGDIAGIEQRVADTLFDLGSLLPQDGLYQISSDAQLAHAITEQADKLHAMSMDTLKRLEENNRTKTTNANFIRYDLFYCSTPLTSVAKLP